MGSNFEQTKIVGGKTGQGNDGGKYSLVVATYTSIVFTGTDCENIHEE